MAKPKPFRILTSAELVALGRKIQHLSQTRRVVRATLRKLDEELRALRRQARAQTTEILEPDQLPLCGHQHTTVNDKGAVFCDDCGHNVGASS